MDIPDATLLTSFARDRDEAAFRTLVKRHLGLVFHTALRRTGNRPLSEEIAQNVLCALANKAGQLASHPDRLAPWLHRATLFESTKAMRAESSRQRREQLQHPDPGEAMGDDDAVWKEALPHLDPALDKLSGDERRVLLLHFFENLTFPKIASLLGRSPAAVQKQSVRALEKLSRVLRSKGVVIPVAVLAAGMTSGLSKAAPVSLVPTITAAALKGSAGVSTGLLVMISTHSKVVVPCALLLLALPLAIQQMAISKVEHQLASGPSGLSAPSTGPPRPASTTAVAKISSSLDVFALADEAIDARGNQAKTTALRSKLSSLESAKLIELVKAAGKADIGLEKRGCLLTALTFVLSQSDHEHAFTAFFDAIKDNAAFGTLFDEIEGNNQLFFKWARQDPSAALSWLSAHRDEPVFALADGQGAPPLLLPDGSLLSGPNTPLRSLQATLVQGMIVSGYDGTHEFLTSLPEMQRIGVLMQSFEDPFPSPWTPDNGTVAVAYLPLIHELIPESYQPPMLTSLAHMLAMWSGAHLDGVDVLFSSNLLTPAEQRSVAADAALMFLGIGRTPPDPTIGQQMDRWLARVIPDQAGQIASEARAVVGAQHEQMAAQTLKALRANSSVDDDTLLHELTVNPLHSHLGEALEQAARIQDPMKRATAIKALNESTDP